MTRYAPQGPPQDGSYQGGESYSYQQPQYGSNDSNYGAYNSGEGQGYGQNYTSQQPQQYGSEQLGAAQSYYGTNNQAYQQYSNATNSQYTGQQYQGGPPSGSPYQQPPPGYAGQPQYPQQNYPPYGQQFAPPHSTYNNPQTGDDDVATFRTHYGQSYDSAGPPPNQQIPADGDADRGFMGAMAGGAAGAYGGHKMNHGVIGGIGGAVAGSMMEDAYKKKTKKEKKQRRGSHSSGSSSSSDSDSDDEKKRNRHHGHESGSVMAGNFSASSREVRIEGHCMLVAECTDTTGRHQRSALDLNDCFTNSNGRLCWAKGGNFAASAQDLRLVDGGSVLEAELGDGKGGWQRNRVCLNERITNDNGRLLMLHV